MDQIFYIPANYDFSRSLLDLLKKDFATEISDLKLFLPNHRLCRQIKDDLIFDNYEGILPQIKAISDLSIEDFFDFLPHKEVESFIEEAQQIKVLDDNDCLFFLSSEIQKILIFRDFSFEQSFKIAIHLKEMFDEIEYEEIDISKINQIDDFDLSIHRQITLAFLKDFYSQIKNILLKKNIMMHSSYHNFLNKKYRELISQYRLKKPTIIAGSTGSISASKKLIKTIFSDPSGYVFLHGYQKNFFTEEESHPQYFLSQLVKYLSSKKTENKIFKNTNNKFRFSPNPVFQRSIDERQKFISYLFLPYPETISWQNIKEKIDIKQIKNDLEENLILICAKQEIQEANIISNILARNTEAKKIGVVCNNQTIKKLIKLNLENLKTPFNDTSSQSFSEDNLSNFLLLLIELKNEKFNSHSFLSFVKNPIFQKAKNHKIISDFETKIIRTNLPKEDFEEINKKITDPILKDFFSTIITNLPLDNSLKSIIQSLEFFSNKSWNEILSNHEAGKEIFHFFEKLKFHEYKPSSSAEFKMILSQIKYFRKSNSACKIHILSSIEARLLDFDLIIVSGLNEGEFPEKNDNSWIGNKIKNDLKINRAIKKIGQNAFDFCHYLSNKKVILTYSSKGSGIEKIPSPFLIKLKTLCSKIEVNIDKSDFYQKNLSTEIDYKRFKIDIPNPKPKSFYRPTKYSITEISNLINNPYSIYVKNILQIEELKEIDFEPSYADFGSFVHKALEEYVKNPENKNFEEIFEKYFFSNEAKLIWFPKFEKLFEGFLVKNEDFLNYKNMLEVPISENFSGIKVSGKVDRVIINPDNSAQIFDYKTGEVPKNKQVISGKEPQLTICAYILSQTILSLIEITGINYWKLSRSSGSKINTIFKKKEDLEKALIETKKGLESLFEYFSNHENGFIATNEAKIDRIKNLSRIQEWNQ